MRPAPSNVPTFKNKSMHQPVPLHHLAPFLHLDLHSAHGCQSSPVPTRCILVSALGADMLRLGGRNFFIFAFVIIERCPFVAKSNKSSLDLIALLTNPFSSQYTISGSWSRFDNLIPPLVSLSGSDCSTKLFV